MAAAQSYVAPYLLCSAITATSTLAFHYFAFRTTPAAYVLRAYRIMGFEMVLILNTCVALLMGCVTGSSYLCMGQLTRGEGDTAFGGVMLHALVRIMVVHFVLEPATDDEVALWTLWYTGTTAVTAMVEVARVRVDSLRQASGGPAEQIDRGLAVFLALALWSVVGLIVVCYLLFGGASSAAFSVVLHDPASCGCSVLQAVGRYFVILKAQGHFSSFGPRPQLFDADDWLTWVDIATELPRSVLGVCYPLCMLNLHGFSVLALLLLKYAGSDLVTKGRRLRMHTALAVLFPEPRPRELRAYHDPCAICYDCLCLDLPVSKERGLLAEDAAVAAALLVAAAPAALLNPPPPPAEASAGARPATPAGAEGGDNSPPRFGGRFSEPQGAGCADADASPGNSPPRYGRSAEGNTLLPQPPGRRPRVPVSLQPRVLPCGHMFHHKCISRWLEEKRECPICKGGVPLFTPPRPPPQPQQRSFVFRATVGLLRGLLPGLTVEVRAGATAAQGGAGSSGAPFAAAGAFPAPSAPPVPVGAAAPAGAVRAAAAPASRAQTADHIQAMLPHHSRETIEHALARAGGDGDAAVHLLLQVPAEDRAPSRGSN